MSTQFGIGVYKPKTWQNIGTLWRTAYIMGASYIFTIGARYKRQASDTCGADKHIPCFSFPSFTAFEKFRPQNQIIIPIENSEESIILQDFEHPKQAVYLLGAEDHGLPPKITNKYSAVTIESSKPICLNVSVAGSIVLYDRNIKLNNS